MHKKITKTWIKMKTKSIFIYIYIYMCECVVDVHIYKKIKKLTNKITKTSNENWKYKKVEIAYKIYKYKKDNSKY